MSLERGGKEEDGGIIPLFFGGAFGLLVEERSLMVVFCLLEVITVYLL